MTTNQTPDSTSESELLETALAACATYGTPILSYDQENIRHYLEGFEHSQTYREAKAALTTHVQKAVLAELKELERVGLLAVRASGASFEELSEAYDTRIQERIQALEQSIKQSGGRTS